jgi:hypothetical protein
MLGKYGYYSCHGSFDLTGIAAAAKLYGTLSGDWRITAEANNDIDTGFSIEAAIPFSAFEKRFIECKFQGSACTQLGDVLPIDILGDKTIPPRIGDTWRANFFFVASQPDAQSAPEGDVGNNTRKNWCWSLPDGEDFHDTTHFGILQFSDEISSPVTVNRSKPGHPEPASTPEFAQQWLPGDHTAIEVVDFAGRKIFSNSSLSAVELSRPLRLSQRVYIVRSTRGVSPRIRRIVLLNDRIRSN